MNASFLLLAMSISLAQTPAAEDSVVEPKGESTPLPATTPAESSSEKPASEVVPNPDDSNAESPGNAMPSSPAESHNETAEPLVEVPAAENSKSELKKNLQTRRRHELQSELEPPPVPNRAVEEQADDLLGALRPSLFKERHPALAFSLGVVVGFGTGYLYTGEHNAGLVFAGLDLLLVGAYVATTVALNQLVIDHDFKSGKSLARDERDFGAREAQLYTASIILAIAEVGSRLFQGFAGMHAVRRTNELLNGFSFIPLEGGGAFQLSREW